MITMRPVRATIHGSLSTAAVLIACLAVIAGCAPEPAPTPAPVASPTQAASPSAIATVAATPSPTPAATTTVTPSPTPSAEPSTVPTPTPTPTPTPIVLAPFTTPAPPKAGVAWTGLKWRKLASTSPLATFESMVRWKDGFVALGPTIPTAETSRTPVWISTDGAHWRPLDPTVLGSATLVVGVGATSTGVVAVTLQGGPNQCDYQAGPAYCWTPAGPLQVWTSSDGSSWTAHAGPPGMAPLDNGCTGCGVIVPTLYAASPGLLLVNGKVTFSADGITWKTVPSSAFPAGFRFESAAPFGSGFLAVGRSGGDDFRATALTSVDGRHWVPHFLPVASADRPLGTEGNRILVGPNGVIVQGTTGGAPGEEIWWTSLDGAHWLRFIGYPPVGTGKGSSTCEAGCAGYPNGLLAADGVHLLAYRFGTTATIWTSSDGRTWHTIASSGTRPTEVGDVGIVPIGVLYTGQDGTTWFGQPVTVVVGEVDDPAAPDGEPGAVWWRPVP